MASGSVSAVAYSKSSHCPGNNLKAVSRTEQSAHEYNAPAEANAMLEQCTDNENVGQVMSQVGY